MKNIFVIGLEAFNLALLKKVDGAEDYAFHELLAYSEAVRPESGRIDLSFLLQKAETQLAEFDGSIDAIIGYWDFPSSVIVPILRNKLGLPAPSLEAVATCEHKYWSRIAQKAIAPKLVPRFSAFDPFADDALDTIDVQYPFWIKPVKAHSSFLGFKIRNALDFRNALPIIRENIWKFANPFNQFLDMVNVPKNIARIDGNHCIAEEIISGGRQCTLEGYALKNEVNVYGVVDSIRSGQHRSSFSRYQYPSQLPSHVQQRMIDAAKKIIAGIGYVNAAFNMEFYWNSRDNSLRLLEINTRLSKSHSPLFWHVDGVPHQQVAIDLALGQPPKFPHKKGKYRVAAKFMHRIYHDGFVKSVPTDEDIQRLEEKIPDVLVRILAHENDRLAHLPYQDSYSFEIAELFLGADTQSELLKKYQDILKVLPFEITPIDVQAA